LRTQLEPLLQGEEKSLSKARAQEIADFLVEFQINIWNIDQLLPRIVSMNINRPDFAHQHTGFKK
jgi:hypothetical protein